MMLAKFRPKANKNNKGGGGGSFTIPYVRFKKSCTWTILFMLNIFNFFLLSCKHFPIKQQQQLLSFFFHHCQQRRVDFLAIFKTVMSMYVLSIYEKFSVHTGGGERRGEGVQKRTRSNRGEGEGEGSHKSANLSERTF